LNTKMKLATLALATFLTFATGIVILGTFTFTYDEEATVGTEEHIRIWLNAGKTIELANGGKLQWTTVFTGINTKSYWIQNDGTVPVTLTLTVASNLPSGWTETWNYDGTALAVGETRTVTLTLTVPTGTPKGTYTWTGTRIDTALVP